jgi:hypothetical protein
VVRVHGPLPVSAGEGLHDVSLIDDQEAAVHDRAEAVLRLLAIPRQRRTPKQVSALATDEGGLRADLDAILGPEEAEELALLRQIMQAQADFIELVTADGDLLGTIAARVAAIYRRVVPQPSAVLTLRFEGRTFRQYLSGRTPLMAQSIKDTDAAWGFQIGNLKDADGEPVDPSTVTIATAVDDATLIALTDNGGGGGTFVFAGTASFTGALPASTGIHFTVTNTGDGSSFTLDDVLTVVAGDAVTADVTYTPPA